MGLKANQITNLLQSEGLLRQNVTNDQPELVLTGVSYNSQAVQPGDLFFIKGNFKAKYLEQAMAKGAAGVVAPIEKALDLAVPVWYVDDTLAAMSIVGMAFYDYPQNALKLVGVTGTKGKTSTAYMMYSILDTSTGHKTALSSTISQITGPNPKHHYRSSLTTPESIDLFKLMREAVDNGMTHMVMEVSSQAFKMRRVYGLRYDVGIFLNISPDHIGENEHPTFADYLAHKLMLIDHSDQVVLNVESDHFGEIMERAEDMLPRDGIWLYGQTFEENWSDVAYQTKYADLQGSQFELVTQDEQGKRLGIDASYQLDLPGDFNESNATAAAIASRLVGADVAAIQTGLSEVKIPGRMQIFNTQKHGTIYVDYAHNYASIAALLQFIRSNETVKILRIVVGAPGNKGVSRRPGIGQAISEAADVAYLTADDPQYEDPAGIADEIQAAIVNPQVEVMREMDRAKAIKLAITASQPDDVVVLAAKGLDEYQKINGVNTPYANDWEIAQEIVADLES